MRPLYSNHTSGRQHGSQSCQRFQEIQGSCEPGLRGCHFLGRKQRLIENCVLRIRFLGIFLMGLPHPSVVPQDT